MSKRTIKVMYTCKGCGVKERSVIVVERQENESLKDWLDRIAQEVGTDHSLHSLRCENSTIDLAIPMFEDAPSIGFAGKQKLLPETIKRLRKAFE